MVDQLDINPVAVRKLVAGGFAQRGSPTVIGTRWLGDGMSGKPAPARRFLKQVAYRGKRRRRLSGTRRRGRGDDLLDRGDGRARPLSAARRTPHRIDRSQR